MNILIFWQICSVIFPVLVMAIAYACYGKSGKLMSRFYMGMLRSRSNRELYSLAVVVLLLAYQILHYMAFGNLFAILPMFVLCMIALFSHRKAEQLFDYLHGNWALWSTLVLVLALMFVPQLFFTAASFGITLAAASFYPCPSARDAIITLDKSGKDLVEIYNNIE
jgi:hypothetical protein